MSLSFLFFLYVTARLGGRVGELAGGRGLAAKPHTAMTSSGTMLAVNQAGAVLRFWARRRGAAQRSGRERQQVRGCPMTRFVLASRVSAV